MQSLIQKHQEIKRYITIIIPHIDIEHALHNELRRISKTVIIDGFRKGKVPMNIIQQHYRSSILKNILNQLMQQYFNKIIKKQKINIAGIPIYKPQHYNNNKDFTYIVEYIIYPEINLNNFKNITIIKPIVSIQNKDIDLLLQILRKKQAIWYNNDKEINIKETSKVTLSFQIMIDNKTNKNSIINNFVIFMERECIIPDLKNKIKGRYKGENFTIDIIFPKNYYIQDLQNKLTKLNITIIKVEQCKLPPLNKNFIKQFGILDGSIDTLRLEIHKNMEYELKNTIKDQIKKQIIDQLIKVNNITIPSTIIDEEIYLIYKHNFKLMNNKKYILNNSNNKLREQVKYTILADLLLNKIIQINSLTVDNTIVQSIIKSIASTYQKPNEIIKYYKSNEINLKKINRMALEEQAIEIILKKVKIIHQEMSFQKLMKSVYTNYY